MEPSKRQEALEALLTLATHDREFLRGMRTDPESTLQRHGFALNETEMDFVRSRLEDGADLNDERFLRQLRQQANVMRW